MRFDLLTLSFCAFVSALPGEDTPQKWGGSRGGDKISHGGNNIGNGNGGGVNIDTGGGDIGKIGVGVGVGDGAGGCDLAACDAQVRFVDIQRGSQYL